MLRRHSTGNVPGAFLLNFFLGLGRGRVEHTIWVSPWLNLPLSVFSKPAEGWRLCSERQVLGDELLLLSHFSEELNVLGPVGNSYGLVSRAVGFISGLNVANNKHCDALGFL